MCGIGEVCGRRGGSIIVIAPPGVSGTRLKVNQYRLLLHATGPGRLPNLVGPPLRGGFGKALKDGCCPFTDPLCPQCLQARECAYGYLFDSAVTDADRVLRRYPHTPHPFVFDTPAAPAPDSSGRDRLAVGLSLVAAANEYLPTVLAALERLGSYGLGGDRAGFEITAVETPKETLWRRGDPPLRAAPEAEVWTVRPLRRGPVALRVTSLTPLRLQVDGGVARSVTARDLLSASLRRLELLCRVHGREEDWDLDAAELVREATESEITTVQEEWRDQDRYSRRQGRSMPLGGLMGEWVLSGPVTRLAPILAAAGTLHVGKSTAFGLGQFRCEAVR